MAHVRARAALNIHYAPAYVFKHARIQIALHRGVYFLYAFGLVRLFKVHFRQHKPKRGRSIAHYAFGFLPIIGLGCELVARYHGPLGHVRPFLREQNFGDKHPNAVFIFVHAVLQMIFIL